MDNAKTEDTRERREFEAKLTEKNIGFARVRKNEDAVLKRRWLTTFSAGADTKGIHVRTYFWHIFSYGRVAAQEKEEAINSFGTLKKDGCYILFQQTTDAYRIENGESLTEDDLACLRTLDIYIVDETFTWTFVLTHEEGFGPYFTRTANG